jgi:HAD superfamily hydrolase (TIGR01509 family)
MRILDRKFWIFDMDGTLTLAVHDFEAIRTTLGLPEGCEILETLAALPQARALPLWRRLDEIEMDLAARASPAPGARALLVALRRRGARLGILTRNSVRAAHETLRVAGLQAYFDPRWVLGREGAAPKPDPQGIRALLSRWQAPATRTVVVGDYLFDLQAGRAAGAATIYVDASGFFPWREHADFSVRALDALLGKHR